MKSKATILTSIALALCLAPCAAFAQDPANPPAETPITSIQASTQASASAVAAKYKRNSHSNASVKVSKSTFKTFQHRTASGRYTYKIVLHKGSSVKTLANDAGHQFLTNGRYLYYAKYRGTSSYTRDGITNRCAKYTLYRLDLNTGKEKNLLTASGDDLVPYAFDGKCLYYGVSKSLYGCDLYAIKISTKKKTHMLRGVQDAQIAKNRIITAPHHNTGINRPVYSFKLGGAGKRKIAKAMEVSVKNNRVYYIAISDDGSKYRKYCCTPTGKNRKALTKWVSNYSSVAFD